MEVLARQAVRQVVVSERLKHKTPLQSALSIYLTLSQRACHRQAAPFKTGSEQIVSPGHTSSRMILSDSLQVFWKLTSSIADAAAQDGKAAGGAGGLASLLGGAAN